MRKSSEFRRGLIHEPSYVPSSTDHLAIFPDRLPDMASVADLTPTQFALAYLKALALVRNIPMSSEDFLNCFHRTCYEGRETTGDVERPRDPYQFLTWHYNLECWKSVATLEDIAAVLKGQSPYEASFDLLFEKHTLPLIKKKTEEDLVVLAGVTSDEQHYIVLTQTTGPHSRPILQTWARNEDIEIITAVFVPPSHRFPPQAFMRF